MRAGDCFLMHTHDEQGQPCYHLFAALTDPMPGNDIIVAVMMKSRTGNTDDTVVLNPGDHRFIRHATAVQYSTAAYFSVGKIDQAVIDGECYKEDGITASVLQRIQKGIIDSPFTVNAIRDYCRSLFEAPR